MRTTVTESRLLVVSDVHLGNRLFRARQPFIEFLKYALENGYSLCINGDGVDIMQTSITQISRDLAACTGHLQKFVRNDLNVYYVVGNHDIVLEHFLDDWEIVRVVPFLNVLSGEKRIRIEHGHLYDDMFVRFPGFYHFVTILGGLALRIHPKVYHGLNRIKEVFLKLRRGAKASIEGDDKEYIEGEAPSFRDAAERVSHRGFDYVVFGHTHKIGQVRLGDGAVYMNTGSWMFRPHFVEITNGSVALKPVVSREAGLVRESWTTLMERAIGR